MTFFAYNALILTVLLGSAWLRRHRQRHGHANKVHHHHVHLSRRALHIVCGMVLMVIGSTIAHLAGETHHSFPTAVGLDALAYGLHGFGTAPIVKVVAEILSIEV